MSKEIETTLRINRTNLIKFHQREIKALEKLIKLHKEKLRIYKREEKKNE